MPRCLLPLVLTVIFATPAHAESGKPVAVRWWGQGMVSIESWWHQPVVIDPFNDEIGYEMPEIVADLVLVTHEHADHNHVEAVGGDPVIAHGLSDAGAVVRTDHTLDRFANEEKPKWQDARLRIARSPNALHVRGVAAWHDDAGGSERGAVAMFAVEVDGVRIAHLGDLGQSQLTAEQLNALGEIDVLCLPAGGVYTLEPLQAVKLIDQVQPRFVVPLHYKTDVLKIDLQTLEPFLTAVGDRYEVVKPAHNTLAVRAATRDTQTTTKVVVLDYKPWKPQAELGDLLSKMDVACKASQEVFAPLSAQQMSWRPPNGSHTPRWNTEHMMGRQLGFFSQIYATIEPETFSRIDLNPKQMPPDYEPAHDEWNGAEEARQMERANAYVRRFAYLLDGIDLDARAPGSRWTLRGLLKQMDRHFGEHTANVEKKFELEGWPTE